MPLTEYQMPYIYKSIKTPKVNSFLSSALLFLLIFYCIYIILYILFFGKVYIRFSLLVCNLLILTYERGQK